MTAASQGVKPVVTGVVSRLLGYRVAAGHWEGRLSSSPLSTATAVIALHRAGDAPELVQRGLAYLRLSQNADGGFGDTTVSFSNLSTTALCWAAFAASGASDEASLRAEAWLKRAVGSLDPGALQEALAARYGKDRTFSVPILTALAISGRLGSGVQAWQHVPQFPFELAACPHRWFQWLRLPVVSYALPALIAIGLVRHRAGRTNALTKWYRDPITPRVMKILDKIQPRNGGFLEAVPLTSFVTMSLLAAGMSAHPVARRGLEFLRGSIRGDGSWPIDTNLATWITTLAIHALGDTPHEHLSQEVRARLASWLLAQQHIVEHPYTHAAPGGWAWTDLPGGVPDADDTAGALVALHLLDVPDPQLMQRVALGLRWLCNLQNRDGGVPTFCRGWGHLPFDRSSPDITAHAIKAWTLWMPRVERSLGAAIARARRLALDYLIRTQQPGGKWVPLWFGNQHVANDENPLYGTSRVLTALAGCKDHPAVASAASQGIKWLCAIQNRDGGWGGDRDAPSSIEETALALEALCSWSGAGTSEGGSPEQATRTGKAWLERALDSPVLSPAPIGFYFAKLWYYDELYPLIFATSALLRASKLWPSTTSAREIQRASSQ